MVDSKLCEGCGAHMPDESKGKPGRNASISQDAKPRAWMPPDNEGRASFMVYADPGEDYIPLFELSSFD